MIEKLKPCSIPVLGPTDTRAAVPREPSVRKRTVILGGLAPRSTTAAATPST